MTVRNPSIDRVELKKRLGFKDKIPALARGIYACVPIPGDVDYEAMSERDGQSVYWDERIYKELGEMTVVVRSATEKKGVHRVFVLCPHCRSLQPIGRVSQHWGTKACHRAEPSRKTILEMLQAAIISASWDVPLGPKQDARCGQNETETRYDLEQARNFRIPSYIAQLHELMPVMPPAILADWIQDHTDWIKDDSELAEKISANFRTLMYV